MLKGATNSNSAVGWRALDKACQVFSGMLTPPQKTIKLWTLFNRSQPSCVSSTHLICQAPLMPRVPPICPPRWASWAHSPQLWRALPSDAMITLSQHLCDNWPSEETARGIPLVRRLQDLAGSAPESWSPAPSSRVKTCNTCLQEVAVLWKTACLVSLSEKSTTSGLNDYRPINLTSPGCGRRHTLPHICSVARGRIWWIFDLSSAFNTIQPLMHSEKLHPPSPGSLILDIQTTVCLTVCSLIRWSVILELHSSVSLPIHRVHDWLLVNSVQLVMQSAEVHWWRCSGWVWKDGCE